MMQPMKTRPLALLCFAALALYVCGSLMGQLQVSGAPAVGQSGNWIVQPGNTANTTPWLATIQQGGNPATVSAGGALKVDGSAATQPISGTVTINAIPAGPNMIGFFKQRPVGCTTAGSADVVHDVVDVATGAGTSVSSVTGCIEECYLNNKANSAVSFRLQTKDGTPIIWVGGNADFSLLANSNMGCGGNGGLNIAGITFVNGITAIAGMASALNFHLTTRE